MTGEAASSRKNLHPSSLWGPGSLVVWDHDLMRQLSCVPAIKKVVQSLYDLYGPGPFRIMNVIRDESDFEGEEPPSNMLFLMRVSDQEAGEYRIVDTGGVSSIFFKLVS